MKLLRITLVLAVAALLFAQADTALQKAIRKETVEGDLKGAIEQYKKLAQDKNRAVAAQALIHMGECYEKLGSKEADKQYELVLNKFADQKDAVAQARAHLGAGTAKTNGMVIRRVWELDKDASAASVSPDGRYIAFIDEDVRGRGNLKLHDLTTGTDRRLTDAASGEFSDESAFSPDGKQIAYLWDTAQTSEIRVLSLSGTAPTVPRVFKIADWRYDRVAWSPDQKTLAVYVYKKGVKGFQGIMLVSVLDGTSRVLPSSGNDDLFFSPDGKYLAYSGPSEGPGSRSGVFVLDISGGGENRAIDYPSRDVAMGWAPDGKHLLFTSDRGGSTGLYALPFRDGKPQGEAALITPNIGDGGPVGLTSAGSLYYHVSPGKTLPYLQIAPFDFATGRVVSPPVTVGTVTEQFGWSPDGKYIAYRESAFPPQVTIRSAETGKNRVVRLDGIAAPRAQGARWRPGGHILAWFGSAGELIQLDVQTEEVSTSRPDSTLGSGVFAESPTWSPDQKKLYFRRYGGASAPAFTEKDLASGNLREIIRSKRAGPSGGLGGPNLSPDGRYIVTNADGKAVVIPTTGGDPKELPGARGNIFISPDGKYIALVSRVASDGNPPAQLIPLGGGEPRELLSATPPLVVSWGMWAPDSRSIFVKKSTINNEQTEIWRIPVEGGQPVKLDMNMNLDHILAVAPWGFSVSPDGRQIAFMRGEANPAPAKDEIWVLENFLSPTQSR